VKVPWLSKKHIEKQATSVITEYERKQGVTVKPPIPVEMIAEQGLGLGLSYDDLRTRLGMDDVLGATYVRLKRICIDESLLDDEVRLNFTCSHEIGHWVLHRQLIQFAARSKSLGETIFCRTKDAVRPIEWQSDYFASCLLMPETDIVKAWNRTFGPKPLVLYNEKKSMCNGPLYFDPCAENWHLIASAVCHTGGFKNCSKQAMIIRLMELGLLRNRSGAHIGCYKSYS
jgi:Zn-dependent peptidase ImmA (M78 family)